MQQSNVLMTCSHLSICILAALASIHLAGHDGAAVSQPALVLHREAQLGQWHGLKLSLRPSTGHERLQQHCHT